MKNYNYNQQNVNGIDKTEPLQRVKRNISTTDDPLSVADLLQKEVSYYKNCHEKTSSQTCSIGVVLTAFNKNERLNKFDNAIRNAPDKDSRDKLKHQLPCIVFGSEPQPEWNASACKPNGVRCICFNDIPQEKIEEAKAEIAECPYVFAVWRATSENEIVALIAYTGTPDMEQLLDAIQANFPYKIDKSCYDISRMQFASHDENIIIKDQVYPVELVDLTEPAVEDDNPLQYKPFPIDCLPEMMRNFISEIQKALGLKYCCMPAVCCLAVISAMIGALCKIRIKEDYEQHAHIYTAIIARSGQAKSGVLNYFLKPIRRIEKNWADEHTAALAKCKQEHQKGKNTKSGQQGAFPNTPNPPKRFLFSDASKAALFKLLKANPLGLLLYLDELDVLFYKIGRNSNDNEQSYYLAIHNGEPLMIDRIKTGGECYIPNPALAICGGIQPPTLQKRVCTNPGFLTSGLYGRLLTAMPPFEPMKINKRVVSKVAQERYECFILNLFSVRDKVLDGGSVYPLVFPISNEAWDILEKYQHKHADIITYETDENTQIESKYQTNVARIALILHVVVLHESDNQAFNEYFEAESTENGRDLPPVSYETMLKACIITEWFVNESKRIYAIFTGEGNAGGYLGGNLTHIQRKVMIVLHKLSQPATIRDLKRSSVDIRNMSDSEIDRVLQELIKAGRIYKQDVFDGYHKTPKTTAYSIVAPVDTTSESTEVNQHDNDNDNITDVNDPDVF